VATSIPFPITLPASSVLGRLALPQAGDAEAIPFAQLAAALGISFLNSPIAKRKTANQSQASNTTLANDNDLLFAIAANEEWTAIFEIAAGAVLSTTGFKVAITAPSGSTLEVDAFFLTDAATGGQFSGSTTTSGANVLANTPPAGANGVIHLFCWVLNGATPGNVALQWAQNASSVTNLTFRKGSFMQASRIA